MSSLSFEVVGARAEPYAVQPTLVLRLRISAGDDVVHAVALQCQIRIEPQRRHYVAEEEESLVELFGTRDRWGETLRPFLWTHVATTVAGFTGSTEIDLAVPCTYDMEVAGTKYLHALADDGDIPLVLLFSGTTFVRRGDGLSVTPVAWHEEATYRLPVRVWRDMMDLYFPNSGWVTVSRPVLDDARPVQGAPGAGDVGPDAGGPAQGSRGGPSERRADRFAAARAVADAVLYEGYVLYPYRASARKNQLRWQFGVLVPQRQAEFDDSERSSLRTECIVDPGTLTARCTSACAACRSSTAASRQRSTAVGSARRRARRRRRAVGRVGRGRRARADDRRAGPAANGRRRPGGTRPPPGRRDVEELATSSRRARRPGRPDPAGRRRSRAHRDAWADGPGAYLAVAVSVENVTDWCDPGATRDDVARHSLVAVHTLLAIDDGTFVSLLEPPDGAAAGRRRVPQRRHVSRSSSDRGGDVVLSSPIILYDQPEIAPESVGDLFDATEIDEILGLRVLTLTDEEKAEARGTDARAADDHRPLRRPPAGGVGPAARRGPLDHPGRRCRARADAVVGPRRRRGDRPVDRVGGDRRRRGRRRHEGRAASRSSAGRCPRHVPRRDDGHRRRRVPRRRG